MNKEIIQLFFDDLYKDKRKMEIIKRENSFQLRKYYICTQEQETEIKVIDYLSEKLEDYFPKIYCTHHNCCEMEYYKGIRVFNLLVFLDAYSIISKKKSIELKNIILNRCYIRQKEIIDLLKEFNNIEYLNPYPIEKVDNVLKILIYCLHIEIDHKLLKDEIERIKIYWNSVCSVPFRDATTKNMLLQCEALNLMNFKDDEERKKFIFDSINNNSIYKYLNEKIIDFDFCSCINKTTLEDDIISFKYHERTWDGQIPNMNEFLGMNPLEFDTYRLGITFLVRFLRFGGRKLAYKIIHKNAFDIRFKYDNPYYYFCMLPVFIEKINVDIISDYPVIFNCIQKIVDCINNFKIDGDYFEKSGIATMELNYSDVFPR